MSEFQFQQKENRNVELSKMLSWILRHGANDLNVPIDVDGYIDVETILKNYRFASKRFTLTEVQNVVASDRKQRFRLDAMPNGKMRIKANQGHSIANVKLTLVRIKDAAELPIAIHGTYYRFWEKIKAEGLNRMTRNHIHLTQTEKFDRDVSGFRSSSEILIYIDVAKAMSDGVEFYRSENNVILTEGINGILSNKYFSKVIDRTTKKHLF